MKLVIFLAILISLSIYVESEEIQNDSDEQFVAIHINHLGVQSINPDLPAIGLIVEPFLPKGFLFSHAVKVTREIVNGFKYEILFVMKHQENDESEIYCAVDVLEKPQLDFRKPSEMLYNNCSLTKSVDVIRFNDDSEENFKTMKDQVVLLKDSEEEIVESSTIFQEDVTLSPLSKTILDDFFSMQNFMTKSETPQTDASSPYSTTSMPLSASSMTTLNENLGLENYDSAVTQEQENSRSVNLDVPRIDNKTLHHLEIETKKAFSELFQFDPEFQQNIITLIKTNYSEAQTKQSIDILARKLKDKIESYRKAQMVNEQQVTLNSGEFSVRKRRSHRNIFVVKNLLCDPFENNILTCADCSLELDENGSLKTSRCLERHKRQGLGRQKKNDLAPGGIRSINIDDPDINLFLTEAVAKINEDEDPDYEPQRILEASVQVVAGTLHRFKVEMKRDKNVIFCNFEVWERVWIKNGREVKVKCENEKHYNFKQEPKKSSSRMRRSVQNSIVGGSTEIAKDDKEANSLLLEHLKRLDTGSDTKLELLSIEKISQQVVAGIKYVITGKFKFGGESKDCDIEIWHRAWIDGEDGTQLKAACDNNVHFKTHARSKRSINHRHHNRPNPDHNDHTKHHHSALKQMKEVKSEILFENYIKKYERRYVNDIEYNHRLKIFKRNLHKIEMLNKHEQGTAKYGISEFSDLTEKEYLRKTGLIVPLRQENDLGNPVADIPNVVLPEEFDWRDKGAVTDVKNQGNCGSCWSFSVTGNVEGLHFIKTGKLEAYSEQELLDCDSTDNACNGGYMDDAFKAIEKIGGLELEEEYPYMARKQNKCMFNQTLSHVKVKGVVDLPKGDEVAMQKFLVSTGPISIGINANAMQFYRGGVSHPWKVLCRKSNLDHGVLIVGFGKKEYPMFNKTLPYWTIKNSWGRSWGEQGYYRVYRGDNTCGVAEMASSSVLE